MNIVFAGTPAFAIPSLDGIAKSTHQLLAIYTQPDRPAGRGRQIQTSAVKKWANDHHLPVYQPINFKTNESLHALASLKPDLLVVIAYGLILPPAILQLPRLGCINVHASLLPRWRGASPIQQAILQGDLKTGITIIQMDEGLDTGNLLNTASCTIEHDSANQLHDRLANLAVKPLLETLDALALGNTRPIIQNNNKATYAPKISKEDALINWKQPAVQIDRQIRAYNPWPIAFTHANNTTIRIHQARVIPEIHQEKPGTILSIDPKGIRVATGEKILLIECLQFPGKKAMLVTDWLHANRNQLHVAHLLK